jgi:glutaredoxin
MKTAELYRMVTPEHICPFGTKAKYLLKRQNFAVEDHLLKTREEIDAFKVKHGVKTTPQTFIDGVRVGGYDDLRKLFAKRPLAAKDQTTYAPVVALFGAALIMAIAITWSFTQGLAWAPILKLFGGLSMCLLAVQKLKDLETFSNSFLNYDLLGVRWVPYSYIYPFVELVAGLGMLSGVFSYATAALAILAGSEGAISVFKAVYIDRRELKCACMGGDSKVPLGFVSLSENILMVAMGIWMAWG